MARKSSGNFNTNQKTLTSMNSSIFVNKNATKAASMMR